MSEGYYLYCVTEAREPIPLEVSGVDGAPVVTITTPVLAAVAHPIDAFAKFGEKVQPRASLEAHERVVEAAWKTYGMVVPFAFGTLLRGDERNLREWMEREHDLLARKLARLKGHAEFGVQLFWKPEQHESRLLADDTLWELKQRSDDADAGTGIAYMHRVRFETAMKQAIARETERIAEYAYERIKNVVADIAEEKIKPSQNEWQMLLKLSCLASSEQQKTLGDLLDEMKRQEGYAIRFTGPWPPYTFARE